MWFLYFLEPQCSPLKMTSVPSQPLRTTPGNKPGGVTRDQSAGTPRSSGEMAQEVSVEAFSGLRLRSVIVTALSFTLLVGPTRCLFFLGTEPSRISVFVPLSHMRRIALVLDHTRPLALSLTQCIYILIRKVFSCLCRG